MLRKIKLRVKKFLKEYTMFLIYLGVIIFVTSVLAIVYGLHERAVRKMEAKYASLEAQYPTVEHLRWRVFKLNMEQRMRNAELLQSAAEERRPVLVVQAGREPEGLARLLRSLSLVRGIEAALLVISHSFYDPEINELVSGVRFCRVSQIFFPNSLQLHPDSFPGPHPGDCGTRRADPFCAARDAALSEHKQHWWWTAHFVFNSCVSWDKKDSGAVVFLQDGSYVAPDLLYMLQYAERALSYHTEADVISLGSPYDEDADYGLLKVDPWWPPYDQGLVLNRSVWEKIEALAERYCAHDDASWSYSLLNVFAGFPRGHAEAVVCAGSRVLRRGDRNGPRDAEQLFPPVVRSLVLAGPGGRISQRVRAPPRGAGGWADPRDQLLCLDPFLVTTTNGAPITQFSLLNTTDTEMILDLPTPP